jgi:hypothetical protein
VTLVCRYGTDSQRRPRNVRPMAQGVAGVQGGLYNIMGAWPIYGLYIGAWQGPGRLAAGCQTPRPPDVPALLPGGWLAAANGVRSTPTSCSPVICLRQCLRRSGTRGHAWTRPPRTVGRQLSELAKPRINTISADARPPRGDSASLVDARGRCNTLTHRTSVPHDG